MNRYIAQLLRLRHGLDLADAGLGSLLDLAIRWWLAGIFWVRPWRSTGFGPMSRSAAASA
ncbi:MAG: hypothetical protein IT562_18515 [Alphaproteobacteria bacterium]|nr:hypothetical protein [Alphaproteobacteria bacterium]